MLYQVRPLHQQLISRMLSPFYIPWPLRFPLLPKTLAHLTSTSLCVYSCCFFSLRAFKSYFLKLSWNTVSFVRCFLSLLDLDCSTPAWCSVSVPRVAFRNDYSSLQLGQKSRNSFSHISGSQKFQLLRMTGRATNSWICWSLSRFEWEKPLQGSLNTWSQFLKLFGKNLEVWPCQKWCVLLQQRNS